MEKPSKIVAAPFREFGEKLTYFRCQADVSRAALSQAASISLSYISAIEAGRCPPPRPLVLKRISAVLALSPDCSDEFISLACQVRGLCGEDAALSEDVQYLLRDIRIYSAALPEKFVKALRRMVREAVET